MRLMLPLGLLILLTACHTPIKQVEPSEAFRSALDEVMLRQPEALKVKPDTLEARREPIVLRLSLQDCVELAMAHNRAILFERLDAELSAADVVAARANLDFRVGANFSYMREESQIDTRFPGDTRDKEITGVTTYGLNASLPFATGTTLEYRAGFVRNASNSPFRTFEYFPSSSVTVRQHLLNGLGFVPNLGARWIAEGNQLVANWQVESTRNLQAFNVAMAYWNLVEAEQELEVFRRGEELANDSLELAQQRLEAEIGTQLEVLQQEANLKSTQVLIIRAEAALEQRVDELLYAIHPDMLHGYALFQNYRVLVQPLTDVDQRRAELDPPTLMPEVQAALRRRPEIRQARKRIENAGIRIEMSEYGLLPTLDVEGTFGNRGIGRDFDDSWENFMEFRNLNYGFGLNFSVPIQNSAARASMTQAEISKRSAILAARDTETGVILEVAAAVRSMRTARLAVEAAEEARRLYAETHEAEQDRQRAGLATSFEVKQALNDLIAAEVDLVKARIAMERGRLELQKATGELGR
jgi:outer membrane protein